MFFTISVGICWYRSYNTEMKYIFVCESGEVVPFEAPLLHFILTFSLALFSLVILVCVTVVFGTHLHSDISTECYSQYPSGTPPTQISFF